MDQANLPVEIIDAEFEVIHDGRPERKLTTWTFWRDDFPKLIEYAFGTFVAWAVWTLTHRH